MTITNQRIAYAIERYRLIGSLSLPELMRMAVTDELTKVEACKVAQELLCGGSFLGSPYSLHALCTAYDAAVRDVHGIPFAVRIAGLADDRQFTASSLGAFIGDALRAAGVTFERVEVE